MPRSFECPACGGRVVTYLRVGEEAVCRQCGARTSVPDQAEEIDQMLKLRGAPPARSAMREFAPPGIDDLRSRRRSREIIFTVFTLVGMAFGVGAIAAWPTKHYAQLVIFSRGGQIVTRLVPLEEAVESDSYLESSIYRADDGVLESYLSLKRDLREREKARGQSIALMVLSGLSLLLGTAVGVRNWSRANLESESISDAESTALAKPPESHGSEGACVDELTTEPGAASSSSPPDAFQRLMTARRDLEVWCWSLPVFIVITFFVSARPLWECVLRGGPVNQDLVVAILLYGLVAIWTVAQCSFSGSILAAVWRSATLLSLLLSASWGKWDNPVQISSMVIVAVSLSSLSLRGALGVSGTVRSSDPGDADARRDLLTGGFFASALVALIVGILVRPMLLLEFSRLVPGPRGGPRERIYGVDPSDIDFMTLLTIAGAVFLVMLSIHGMVRSRSL